jgi:hypothetical protein
MFVLMIKSSTVRVWVLGIGFVIVGAFINQLFDIRQPRIAVEANVAQLLICESPSTHPSSHSTPS